MYRALAYGKRRGTLVLRRWGLNSAYDEKESRAVPIVGSLVMFPICHLWQDAIIGSRRTVRPSSLAFFLKRVRAVFHKGALARSLLPLPYGGGGRGWGCSPEGDLCARKAKKTALYSRFLI